VKNPETDAFFAGSLGPELAEYFNAHLQRQRSRGNIEVTKSLSSTLQRTIEQLRLAEDELYEVRSQAEHDRARYYDLFEFAPDGYLVTDAHGKILEANVAAHRILQSRPTQRIVGKPLVIFLARGDRQLYFRALKEMRHQARGSWRLHIVSRGSLPPVIDVTVGAIREGSDEPQGFRWIIRDLSDQSQLHYEVQKHRDDLKALAAELASAEERERRRIAVGLHDRISQTLAASKLLLGQIRQSVHDSEGKTALNELRTLLDSAIAESRSLTFELSPPMLHQLGLAAALQWLAEEIARRHGPTVKIVDELKNPLLGPEQVTALLFQAVRELLNNVVKHADATEVTVTLTRRDDCISIAVRDDGKGFAVNERAIGPAESRAGFGLFNIRTRIEQIGGHFNIRSSSSSGTSIMLVVPLVQKEGKPCPLES
jgi:PAS domain S-box-containing protein